MPHTLALLCLAAGSTTPHGHHWTRWENPEVCPKTTNTWAIEPTSTKHGGHTSLEHGPRTPPLALSCWVSGAGDRSSISLAKHPKMFESPRSRLSLQRTNTSIHRKASQHFAPVAIVRDRGPLPLDEVGDGFPSIKRQSSPWHLSVLPLLCAQGFPSFPLSPRKNNRKKPAGGVGAAVGWSEISAAMTHSGHNLYFFSSCAHTMTMKCFQFLSVACALDTASGFGLGGGRVAGHHSVASSTRRCEIRRVVSCFSCVRWWLTFGVLMVHVRRTAWFANCEVSPEREGNPGCIRILGDCVSKDHRQHDNI